jgi:hypothetical protein
MAWFAAVLELLALRVAEVRARWAARPAGGSIHDGIDGVLSAAAEGRRAVPGAIADSLAGDPGMARLAATLGLGRREIEWVGVLAAVQMEPRLGRVLGYLDDEPLSVEPSPAIAAEIWAWPDGWWPGAGSAVIRWGIAGPVHDRDFDPRSPWSLEPDIAGFLAGRLDWWSTGGGLSLRTPRPAPGTDPGIPADCLYPSILSRMMAAATAGAGSSLVIEIVGPWGSGRRTLMLQLCRELGRDALVAAPSTSPVRALRTAALMRACLVQEIDEGQPEPAVDDRAGTLTLLARTSPGTGSPQPAGFPGGTGRPVRLSFEVPGLDRAARLRLWTASTRLPAPRAVADWTLTPGQIAAAVAAAPVGPAAVTAACRYHPGGRAASLLTALSSPYGWDDLVVAEDVGRQLHDLENQVRFRTEVLDEWGFARLTPHSRGTAALFAGPSGTGKTMAVQILARSLELDLYRVDLAQVVNKYIGETEKRLSDLFDQCEHSNVMVLFDEADALFGQRTQVRDAHDRFANIEIDYLLQRIESFNGVAVLATNRKGDLDPGFLRRLRIIVDFRPPKRDERRRLWDLALPELAPSGAALTSQLDRDWLAENIELTGAQIKVVSLNAAYLARAQRRPIEHQDLLAAARLELAKQGTVLRTERHNRPAVTR